MKRKHDPLDELPPPFCSPEFKEAWEDYEGQRKERRKPITPIARKLIFRDLAGWGETRAIAALRHSAKCNYQGCFEPPPERNGNSYQPSSKASRSRDAAKQVLREARNGNH